MEYERERKRIARNIILDHLNNTLGYCIHDKDLKLFSHWQYKPSFRFVYKFNIERLGLRQDYDENLSISEQIIIRPNQSNYSNNPRANRNSNLNPNLNSNSIPNNPSVNQEQIEALENVRS